MGHARLGKRDTWGLCNFRYDRLGNTEILKAERGMGMGQYCAASFRGMRGSHSAAKQGPGSQRFLGTLDHGIFRPGDRNRTWEMREPLGENRSGQGVRQDSGGVWTRSIEASNWERDR